MKKFLCCLAAATLVVSFAACGNNNVMENDNDNIAADPVEDIAADEEQTAVDIDNVTLDTLVVNTCGVDIDELYISTGQGWSEELLMGTSIQNGGTMPVTIDFNKNLDSYDLKAVSDGEEIEFKDMYLNASENSGITINLTETEGGYLATAE